MELKSDSYNPSYCCVGADCYKFGINNENEPCWGNVMVIDKIQYDDDYSWVHACQGHWDSYDGGVYLKECDFLNRDISDNINDIDADNENKEKIILSKKLSNDEKHRVIQSIPKDELQILIKWCNLEQI